MSWQKNQKNPVWKIYPNVLNLGYNLIPHDTASQLHLYSYRRCVSVLSAALISFANSSYIG